MIALVKCFDRTGRVNLFRFFYYSSDHELDILMSYNPSAEVLLTRQENHHYLLSLLYTLGLREHEWFKGSQDILISKFRNHTFRQPLEISTFPEPKRKFFQDYIGLRNRSCQCRIKYLHDGILSGTVDLPLVLSVIKESEFVKFFSEIPLSRFPELDYQPKNLREEIRRMKFNSPEFIESLHKTIEPGRRYTKREVKEQFQRIYDSFDQRKKAKSIDILKYYNVVITKVPDFDGRRQDGYKVISYKKCT